MELGLQRGQRDGEVRGDDVDRGSEEVGSSREVLGSQKVKRSVVQRQGLSTQSPGEQGGHRAKSHPKSNS